MKASPPDTIGPIINHKSFAFSGFHADTTRPPITNRIMVTPRNLILSSSGVTAFMSNQILRNPRVLGDYFCELLPFHLGADSVSIEIQFLSCQTDVSVEKINNG